MALCEASYTWMMAKRSQVSCWAIGTGYVKLAIADTDLPGASPHVSPPMTGLMATLSCAIIRPKRAVCI